MPEESAERHQTLSSCVGSVQESRFFYVQISNFLLYLGVTTPTLTPLQEALFFLRVLYDLSFFFLVIIIIIQNLIFGVIIDTFADLRSEKNKKEYQLKNTCFICGEYQR